MDFIDLRTQYQRLRGPVERRIQAVLDHGQYILGPEVEELEARLADFVGERHCVGVSSGTDALLIALMTLGIGPGDEVITTPFTFLATAETVALLGAVPVFVDIDRRTYNIDPRLIGRALSPRTKAIIAVSLYGQCADFDAINDLAARHRLVVIEDAAQSLGATYKGRRSCGLSPLAVASFYPSKPLGCYGDAGAVFAADAASAERARELRVHGQDRQSRCRWIGINGRIDTLQAAILLAKLELFEEELEARERVGALYSVAIEEAFRDSGASPVGVPYIEPHNRSAYAQYTIEVPERDAVRERMKSAGIPTAVHYATPLHLHTAFERFGRGPGSLPVAEEVAGRVLSLPMHPYLTEDEQMHVVGALKKSVESSGTAELSKSRAS